MGRCISYLRQRKGTVTFAVALYLIVFYAVYTRFWKPTSHMHVSVDVHSGLSWNIGLWNQQGTAGAADDEGIDTDIHLEDDLYGHTGEVTGDSHHSEIKSEDPHRFDPDPKSIAIGLGITSKGIAGADENNIAAKFQLFHTFMPTFCKTASPGYKYSFYLAYDHTDPLFSKKTFLDAFRKAFYDTANYLCTKDTFTSIHLVQCSHAGKPAWAQNDAMLEAYLDNIAYFYRVNDDTRMLTGGWVEAFTTTLSNYDPSNIGVVGPNHSGGNTAILTYDFVSQHHLRAFGFYYPRLFTDWWGDDWVTLVYRPDRSTKLNNIKLAHTLGAGQRYGVRWEVGKQLNGQVAKDKISLQRYIEYQKSLKSDPVKYERNGKKVIAISLFGRDPKYTWGAIRQAQTIAWYFPGWTFRVYVPGDDKGRPLMMTRPKSKKSDEKSAGGQSILSGIREFIFGSESENSADDSSVSVNLNPVSSVSSPNATIFGGNQTILLGNGTLGGALNITGAGNFTQNNIKSAQEQNEIPDDGLSVELRRALVVPTRIRNKLRQLGAQIVPVPVQSGIPARLLQYTVADDPNVEIFLIRSADTRFSDRESAAVSDWFKKMEGGGESTPLVHCMRDHKKHSTNRVIEGLWGANAAHVRKTLQANTMASTIAIFYAGKSSSQQSLTLNGTDTRTFLETILWPAIGGRVLCHEGYCDATKRIPGYENFPVQRVGDEYIGRRFDEHQEPVAENNLVGGTVPECGTNAISDTDRLTAAKFIGSVAEESKKIKSSSALASNAATVPANIPSVAAAALTNVSANSVVPTNLAVPAKTAFAANATAAVPS